MIETIITSFSEIIYNGLFPYKMFGLHGFSAVLLEYIVINGYILAVWYCITKGKTELNLS